MTSSGDQFFIHNNARICFRIYGNQTLSHSVFYFHGLPGSRIEASLISESALARGMSIIAIDRPGIGESDYIFRNSVDSWPAVIKALASHLGIRRFQILALSGGGPYALATAREMPDLVQSCAFVSCALPFGTPSGTEGMTTLNRLVLALIGKWPAMGRFLVSMIALLLRNVPATWILLLKFSSSADRKVLNDQALSHLLKVNFREAVRKTSRGSQDEVAILAQKEELLPIKELPVPFVIYHGDADTIVPVSVAYRYKQLLPHATLTIFPGEGHFLIIPRLDEILASLC